MNQKITVCRKEHFNAAHRLHNPELSNAENQRLFGKCNHPNYHGHNYDLIVAVSGEIDPETGFVIDTKHLSDLIKQLVLDEMDHRNLNLDVPGLAGKIPTTEILAMYIYDVLRAAINSNLDLKITLYETERNFVVYPA
jgi:6-pyruvoyltetrahydropterin/6-carboxytetrahydropterin synthase